MHTLNESAAAATSYIVALLTLGGVFLTDHYGMLVQALGLILLIARLVREVPAAVRVLHGYWKGNT